MTDEAGEAEADGALAGAAAAATGADEAEAAEGLAELELAAAVLRVHADEVDRLAQDDLPGGGRDGAAGLVDDLDLGGGGVVGPAGGVGAAHLELPVHGLVLEDEQGGEGGDEEVLEAEVGDLLLVGVGAEGDVGGDAGAGPQARQVAGVRLGGRELDALRPGGAGELALE